LVIDEDDGSMARDRPAWRKAVSATHMNLIRVDENEFRASRNVDDALVSYGVGSAMVVALYDPATQVGGLLRFTEPDSRADVQRSRQTPARYADSGIAALLDEVSRLGAAKSQLSVRIAGGSDAPGAGSNASGKRNYLAIRKNLWKLGVFVQSEAAGGTAERNVRLEIKSGQFWTTDAARANGFPIECVLKGVSQCSTQS
jgi:chemotaxis protein CheD